MWSNDRHWGTQSTFYSTHIVQVIVLTVLIEMMRMTLSIWSLMVIYLKGWEENKFLDIIKDRLGKLQPELVSLLLKLYWYRMCESQWLCMVGGLREQTWDFVLVLKDEPVISALSLYWYLDIILREAIGYQIKFFYTLCKRPLTLPPLVLHNHVADFSTWLSKSA